MAIETVETLIDAGRCSAGPPLGPQLGPLGVNIGQVVAAINDKTKDFAGMKVPVKVVVDAETKEFEIEIGTPPTSQLIKKEAGIEKGSGNPKTDMVADVLIEQCIKIAKMKDSALLGKNLKNKVKEIIGTCVSMGILVEGKQPQEATKMVNEGKFDEEIRTEKTELTAEEKKKLEVEKKKLAAAIEKRRAQFEKLAKEILASMEGKERGAIKAKMKESNIPDEIIKEILPVEGAAAAEGEAPVEGAPAAEGAEAPEGEKPAEPAAEAPEEKKE